LLAVLAVQVLIMDNNVTVLVAVAAEQMEVMDKLQQILKLDLVVAVVDPKVVLAVAAALVVNLVEVCRGAEVVVDRLDLEDQTLLVAAAAAVDTLAVVAAVAVMTLERAPEIPLAVVADLDLLLVVLLMGQLQLLQILAILIGVGQEIQIVIQEFF
jgi:hypothetical protein